MMSSQFYRLSTTPDASGEAQHGTVMSILSIIERLRETLVAENGELSRRAAVDHQAYNLRKSHGLLELNRLFPAVAGLPASPALHAAFVELDTLLEDNKRMLSMQLDAAHTVSNIIARAIRDSQSDGTYSALIGQDDDE